MSFVDAGGRIRKDEMGFLRFLRISLMDVVVMDFLLCMFPGLFESKCFRCLYSLDVEWLSGAEHSTYIISFVWCFIFCSTDVYATHLPCSLRKISQLSHGCPKHLLSKKMTNMGFKHLQSLQRIPYFLLSKASKPKQFTMTPNQPPAQSSR